MAETTHCSPALRRSLSRWSTSARRPIHSMTRHSTQSTTRHSTQGTTRRSTRGMTRRSTRGTITRNTPTPTQAMGIRPLPLSPHRRLPPPPLPTRRQSANLRLRLSLPPRPSLPPHQPQLPRRTSTLRLRRPPCRTHTHLTRRPCQSLRRQLRPQPPFPPLHHHPQGRRTTRSPSWTCCKGSRPNAASSILPPWIGASWMMWRNGSALSLRSFKRVPCLPPFSRSFSRYALASPCQTFTVH
mmetsp:Transcript_9666/g.23981  ORF Transcript_9666/g.23981 Transcript_9666/m.23981 type:complete len:241 (+) Transcript_9666:2347-3069(+)